MHGTEQVANVEKVQKTNRWVTSNRVQHVCGKDVAVMFDVVQ